MELLLVGLGIGLFAVGFATGFFVRQLKVLDLEFQLRWARRHLEHAKVESAANFAAGKAFVISSTSGFVYVYDMNSLKPAGRIKIGTNQQLETATTDTADEKLYLAESTTNEVIIIDGKTQAITRVGNVGLYPWGTHVMDSKDNYCH